ncbi:polysaccharide biosynthesis/export family protein [Tamlana fucoidanivorans]|uniref:Polysaccharide export protein n=1 Tax=Allotamlana fucoidanivorans TaxID=2583814 RepID=A0A5C4SQH2_9FLAO|nr:polysaccharide biosynthesis/export family protein [Tamlana fucoidanivorans]TNJ46454.1 polysaccharide export protein [Tamlana fucoidanivorans]
MSRLTSTFKLIIVLYVLALVSSCSTKKDIVYFQNAKNAETIVDTNTFNATLKTGDLLSIYISTPDLTVTQPYNLIESTGGNGQGTLVQYLIDSEGNVDYPVLGKVKLEGLTIEEAKQLFKKKFEDGKLLKDPVVIMRINNYRVSVFGQVNNPGVYPVTGERISILEALSAAGDLAITGKRDNVLVIRDFNGAKTYTRIDLTSKEVFNSPVYYLTQNDVVYVEPNSFGVSRASGDARIGVFASLLGLAITIGILFTR